MEYTPYGSVSRNTGPYATDKRFTGKTWDESSSLFYYGARYYDPELGRFTQADPTIQHPNDPQDFNRYAYARNSPVVYRDFDGLSWWSAFWNAIAGFFGAVAAVVVSAVTMNPVLGAAVGGAVAGAIMGGVTGGLEGALKGAAMGFVIGGALGFLGPEVATIAAIGGAVYAGVTGGLEGLGDFAAGVAGAYSGYYAGQAIVHGTTNLNSMGTPKSSKTGLSPESQNEVNKALGKGDFEQVKYAVEQGTGKSTGLSGNDTGESISEGIKNRTLGTGNNPDINLKTSPTETQTALNVKPEQNIPSYESERYTKARYILKTAYDALKNQKETPINPPSGGVPEPPTGWGGLIYLIGGQRGWF